MRKGVKHSKETKLKISLSKKGCKANSGSFKKGMVSPNKGKKLSSPSIQTKHKMSISRLGIKFSEETKLKISKAKKGFKHSEATKEKIKLSKIGQNTRERHYKWISDRTQIKSVGDSEERRSQKYKDWRKEVWKRDNYKCRIADDKCNGRIEAHHILGFTEYPELRYQSNNGITLCHAHHPRKRAEEKRLIPTFVELVSMSVSK